MGKVNWSKCSLKVEIQAGRQGGYRLKKQEKKNEGKYVSDVKLTVFGTLIKYGSKVWRQSTTQVFWGKVAEPWQH